MKVIFFVFILLLSPLSVGYCILSRKAEAQRLVLVLGKQVE